MLQYHRTSAPSANTANVANSQTVLYSWGDNSGGQIGDNTNISESNIQAVSNQLNGQTISVLSPGSSHVMAILADGSLWAWGKNNKGQLGNNTIVDAFSPIKIGTSSWTKVSSQQDSVVAIKIDGTMWAWGNNSVYQLGDGTTVDKSSPVQIYGNYFSSTFDSWKMSTTNTDSVSTFSHSLAIRQSDSSLWAWGDNSIGQLGDGTTISKSSPVLVSISSWSSVHAGRLYSAGITVDGKLFTWGTNDFGQLGSNAVGVNRSSPVQIGTSSWSMVSTGWFHTVAIDINGGLFAWGNNQVGQLGNTNLANRSSPFQVGTSSWTSVSAGGRHTLAIDINGGLFVWGQNTVGHLGDGTTINKSSPVQIGTSSWSSVAAGASHSVATTINNRLFAWGNNVAGQLGDGTTINKSSPVQVPVTFQNSTWKAISVAQYSTNVTTSTLAIRQSDGALFAWGLNNSGQLGDGTTINKSLPVQIGTSSWNVVSAGESHSAAIDINGRLFTWGNGGFGQLGDGTAINKSSPVLIGSSSWTTVSAGDTYTIGITTNGNLFSWGEGSNGELGVELLDSVSRSSPVLVSLTDVNTSWKQISIGGQAGIGIRSSDSSMWTWGVSTFGQIGDNGGVSARWQPVRIGFSSWSVVSAGASHMSAIDINGRLFAWGHNNVGQLGDGTTINKSSPVQVAGTVSFNYVDAGNSFTLALSNTNTLYAWGINDQQQLGDGTTVNKSSPVLITGNSNTSWKMIVAAGRSFFGIREGDGALFAWGQNDAGHFGDGTTINKSSPIQIGTSSWTMVSSYGGNGGNASAVTAAIDINGRLFTWGNNQALGDGAAARSSPVQIGTSSWTMVSIGQGFGLSIDINGILYAWGFNGTGQLGDGTTVDKTSPVQIGTSSWSQVSAGQQDVVAINSLGRLFTWGRNNFGQLGDGTTVAKSSPVQIGTSLYNFVNAGQHMAAAIDINGRLFTWGANFFNGGGQLGDGTTVNKSSPVLISSGNSFTFVGVNYNTCLGITTTGTSLTWGNNAFGQLGDGTTVNRSTPVTISPQSNGSWFFGASGEQAKILYNRIHRNAYAFGSGDFGQLGNGTTVSRSSPVLVSTIPNNSQFVLNGSWTAISTGNFNSAGIYGDGALYTWGNNQFGQLGTNDIRTYLVGMNKIGTFSWTKISVGDSHMVGITTANTAFAWGLGTSGQLGSPDLLNRSTPTQVPLTLGTSKFKSISMHASTAVAVRSSDGALFTWGGNQFGYLGDGTTINKITPVKIGNSSWTIAGASNGQEGPLWAIDINGNAYAWGTNGNSQIDDSATNRSSPVLLATSTRVKALTFAGATGFYLDTDGAIWSRGNGLNGVLGDGTVTGNKITWGKISSTSSFSIVNAGQQHCCAIDITGGLWAWGENSFGQLGDNTTINQSTPIKIGSSSWAMVAAGRSRTFGITVDGRLFSWGNNSDGSLGSGNTVNRSSPVQIGTSSWSFIASAKTTTAAGITVDGRLFYWGFMPQIANPTSPVQIGVGSSYTIVAAASGAIIALPISNLLESVGTNNFGIMGIADGSSAGFIKPVAAPVDNNAANGGTYSNSWAAVSTGFSYSAGLFTDGSLYVWGRNLEGQAGDTTQVNKSSPTKVGSSSWSFLGNSKNGVVTAIDITGKGYTWGRQTDNAYGYRFNAGFQHIPSQIYSLTNNNLSWLSVSAGSRHALALTNNYSLYGWGYNQFGQLGNPQALHYQYAAIPIDTISSWTFISAGNEYSSAIKLDGSLWMWGSNDNGNIDITFNNKSVPFQIGTSSWSFVNSGFNKQSSAIDINGRLFAWGYNANGTYGNGTTVIVYSPIQIGTASWKQVVSNPFNGAGITANNSAYVWGQNAQGQIGDGTTISKFFPVLVSQFDPTTFGYSSWTTVAAGFDSSLGILTTGALYAWGLNSTGQLGTGTTVNRNFVNQVADTFANSQWRSISNNFESQFGAAHAAAVRQSDGSLWVWGENQFGQLGDGTTVNKSSPIQLGTSSWSIVSVGGFHTAAIDITGRLFTWGRNSNGQLGQNISTATNRSSPVQIGTSLWSVVSAGITHTMMIDAVGRLFATGAANQGQTGLNSSIQTSSPAQVGTSSWTTVSAAERTTGGILITGALFMWGGQAGGQIGNSTNNNSFSSPVRIGTSSWSMVSVSASNTMAIDINGRLFGWGYNEQGQVGINSVSFAVSSPVQIGTSSWSQVSAGDKIVSAIRLDGRLFTWGQNNVGQLGDGTTVDKSSPVQIGTSSWTLISSRGKSVFAANENRNLFTWGSNTKGELGNNSIISRSSPVILSIDDYNTPATYNSFISIGTECGALQTLAITSANTLFSWGRNNNGQLGDGTTINKLVDQPIGYALNKEISFKQLSSGSGDFYFALAANTGNVYTWGQNFSGNLGNADDGFEIIPQQLPISNIFQNNDTWKDFCSAYYMSIGIKQSDSSLWAWGLNNSGQLGDNTTVPKSSPIQIGTRSWKMVSASRSNEYVLAIDMDNKLWAWGNQGFSYRLGDGTTLNRSSPVQIGNSSWNVVSAGDGHSLAIDVNGNLYSWGIGSNGELGNGFNNIQQIPSSIANFSSWSMVSAGSQYSLGLSIGGKLWAWGYNATGQLGDGTTVDKNLPVEVGLANAPITFTSFSASYNYIFAVSNNVVYSWGLNTDGQLGNGTTINKLSVTAATPHISQFSWRQINCSRLSTFGIKDNGSLWAWGDNFYAQLGDGTTVDKSSPVQIGTSSWTMVSSSGTSTFAIDINGRLFSWGRNTTGQLGSGTTVNRSSPVQVGTSSWTMVKTTEWADGSESAAAIDINGRLFTWGLNATGQLGDGTTVNKSSPIQIGTSSWSFVTGGTRLFAGITSNNNLFVWGSNDRGQIGDGTTINKSSPVQIGTSLWTMVSSVLDTTLGITQTGALFAWGSGTDGQIGDNTALNRSSPVKIGNSSWTIVGGNSIALDINGNLYAWGYNANGNYGNLNNTNNRSSPVIVRAFNNSWINAKTGLLASIAINNLGELFTWGQNNQGQLGDGTTVNKSTPVQIMTGTSFIDVISSQTHSAAIDINNSLYTWGLNSTSQLGHGDTFSRSTPLQVGVFWEGGPLKANNVYASTVNIAFKDLNGRVHIAGDNQYGQIGDGTIL